MNNVTSGQSTWSSDKVQRVHRKNQKVNKHEKSHTSLSLRELGIKAMHHSIFRHQIGRSFKDCSNPELVRM